MNNLCFPFSWIQVPPWFMWSKRQVALDQALQEEDEAAVAAAAASTQRCWALIPCGHGSWLASWTRLQDAAAAAAWCCCGTYSGCQGCHGSHGSMVSCSHPPPTSVRCSWKPSSSPASVTWDGLWVAAGKKFIKREEPVLYQGILFWTYRANWFVLVSTFLYSALGEGASW
jgi:hypothetical protein